MEGHEENLLVLKKRFITWTTTPVLSYPNGIQNGNVSNVSLLQMESCNSPFLIQMFQLSSKNPVKHQISPFL